MVLALRPVVPSGHVPAVAGSRNGNATTLTAFSGSAGVLAVPSRQAPNAGGSRRRVRVRVQQQKNGRGSSSSGSNDDDLLRMQEELLQQIEQRKALQSKLLEELREAGVPTGYQETFPVSAPPAAPPKPTPPPRTQPGAPKSAASDDSVRPNMTPAAVIAANKKSKPAPQPPADAAAPKPPPAAAAPKPPPPAAAAPKPPPPAAAAPKPPSPAAAAVAPPAPKRTPAQQPTFKSADVDDLQLLTEQFENRRTQRSSSGQPPSGKVSPPPKAAPPKRAPPAAPAAPPPPPPPLAGDNVMKIVFVGAEMAPWSKTGGLGDVMGALPKALARRGHRVMAIAPRYANYDDVWDADCRRTFNVFGGPQEVAYFHTYRDGVDYVFVDHPAYHAFGQNIYGGERQDIQFRCALLSKAALEAVWHVPCGGVPYGDDNLVFIANDWHTALLPLYLQAHYRDHGKMEFVRSAFVIHNMAHQGRGPMTDLANLEVPEHYNDLFLLDDPIGGEHMNIMKAALITSHRIVAVSHGYAWECQTPEGGWGLDQVVRDQAGAGKLRGVVNGIDYQEWSPMHDPHLKEDGYMNFSADTLVEGKAACKAALQRELGLPVNPDAPLLGFIGRLDYQKGVDLIKDNYDWLMGEGVQLVMLGSGREDLEAALREMESRNHDKCRGWVGFSVKMAHRITAACDILLMPSRFEPCGLNQLYAMAYGTVPVVHAVGGLRDTVQPFNPDDNSGTGWTFNEANANAMRYATNNALYTYREFRGSFQDIARRGMRQDLSWDNAAAQYEDVLVQAKYVW